MNALGNYINSILFRLLPETKCFGLKRNLLRMAGAHIGRNVRVCSSVTILGTGELTIGDDTWVGHEVFISTTSHVTIGKNVDIAPRVYIGTGTHLIDRTGSRSAGEGVLKDVTIGNGVWLCVGCLILPGVSVGDKTVVAAGAVVTRSCDKMKVVGGVPATELKDL